MAQTSKVGGRATSIYRSVNGIGVMYHTTLVAFKRFDGTVVLNSNGWTTATTKLRMNQFSNEYCGGAYHVYQKDHVWYVSTKDGDVEYFDQMEIKL